MGKSLNGKRVAILVAEGFEQSELEGPKQALEEAGAETLIVSPAEEGWVQGWQHFDLGDLYEVDVPLAEADAAEFDALLLPGGVANPDQLRMQPEAVEFVRAFFDAGKPVAAICHAPWTLIEAGVVKGRTLTSWPSVKTDLVNAFLWRTHPAAMGTRQHITSFDLRGHTVHIFKFKDPPSDATILR